MTSQKATPSQILTVLVIFTLTATFCGVFLYKCMNADFTAKTEMRNEILASGE